MSTPGLFSTVLVGSDGSASAAQAIEIATSTVAGDGSLEIVGAAKSDGDKAALEQTLAEAAADLTERGFSAGFRVAVGDPVEVILDAAKAIDANLIVLGNKGMTGARRFILGSVPDKVSHQAECSVLIARTT